MKKDKELIDFIVDKLKNNKEQLYREGAWEKFKAGYSLPEKTTGHIRKMWYAAASVLLLVGLGAAWLTMRETVPSDKKVAGYNSSLAPKDSQAADVREDSDNALMNVEEKNTPGKRLSLETTASLPVYRHRKEDLALLTESNLQMSADAYKPTILPLQVPKLSVNDVTRMESVDHLSKDAFAGHLASGTARTNGTLSMKEVEPQNQSKRILLSNRFELGVFVSPYATEQKMNVGGGFMLGFKLSKRLTVRTGASYNTYEVNTLKNPLEESSTETVVAEAAVATESMRFTPYQQRVIIPNINAVTGFVQSIDIPLELKFHATRSLYAVAGMSYSSILNQERNAYYIDNINQETFAEGYPETQEQAVNAVKPVTKSIESTEKNVSTNGFTGFVNLSIGKDLRVNKNIGVSLEPYLKIPVGGYRRADMDYTNGGIRIMTSF